jgi:putative cardiolipin synthase
MLTLLGLLGACAGLPPNVARAPEAALPASPDSPLVQMAKRSTPDGGESGVRLMPLGVYSLEARIRLAERATRSLDLQYYVLENDATGRLLLRKLRDAAQRGVRVRLLLDDLYTGRTDEMLRALATYPNIEIRLFNPFCCARSGDLVERFAASIFDVRRLNHRMHNKLFIADSAMAVIGGRNIADEYFLRSPQQNFVDIDAFVIGAAVGDMTGIFDRYWNSNVVRPIQNVGDPLPDAAEGRRRFEQLADEAPRAAPLDPPSVDVLGYGPLGEELEAGRIGMVWGQARVFADPPDKLLNKTAADAFKTSVTRDVMQRVWQARSELVVTTPYMIPGPRGMATIDTLRARGVKITVVTNSLAATDEPLVHNGYSRYRYDMLKAGVDLYELSPTRTQHTARLGFFGSSLGRLHAKTAVIDRETVFIGSMNLDPRSASENTEFGMFIDSPAVAKELLRIVNISKLQSAYRVRIEPNGTHLEWITADDDKEIILTSEPEVSPWLRLHNMVFGWFVPEQLL